MKEETLGNSRTLPHWTADTPVTADNLNKMVDAIQTALNEVNVRLSTAGGTILGELNVKGRLARDGNAVYDTGNKPTPAEIGALGDTGEFLPQGADLNTYRSPGCWQWSRSGLTQDFQNAPIQNGYGIFTVTAGRGFVEQRLALMYVDENYAYRVYKRTYGNDTQKWTPWVMSYDTGNRPTPDELHAVEQHSGSIDLSALDRDKYYPVVLSCESGKYPNFHFMIWHNANREYEGSVNGILDITFNSSRWGNYPPFLHVIHDCFFGDYNMVGKIEWDGRVYRLAVYLRGGLIYPYLTHNSLPDIPNGRSFATVYTEAATIDNYLTISAPYKVPAQNSHINFGTYESFAYTDVIEPGSYQYLINDVSNFLYDNGARVYSPNNPPSQRGVISDLVRFNQDGTYLFWSELPFEYTHYRFSLPNISFLVAQQEGARLSVFYLDSAGAKHSRVSTNDNNICGFNINPSEKPVYWVRV